MSNSIDSELSGLPDQPRITGLLYRYILLPLIFYIAVSSVYSLYFSPLSSYPGPKLYALTKVPITWYHSTGSIIKHMANLHAEYGPIVRIGPSELSYIDPVAWKDIYGFKTSTGGQMPKDPAFYNLEPDKAIHSAVNDLVDESHARQRKVFSHAFSDRALREQEKLILSHVNKLVSKLFLKADGDEEVDVVRLLNFTTFDIMSDLAFGEPLNMLEGNEYHEWVAAVFDNLHAIAIMHAFLQFPAVKFIFGLAIPPSLMKQRDKHHRFTKNKVDTRLAKQTPKPDIWSLVINAKEKARVTQEEMYENASLFMVAGTETTATLLSGLMYLLLTHTEKMGELKREVRALREDELNLLVLPRLEYLNACIEEGLRIYPPVPGGLPRMTPKEGAVICGKYVPGHTRISVPHHAAYQSPTNFTLPKIFAPERWLGAEEYKSDARDAFNPFSTGPRNCLGKNLAYHEMRLILAKLIWNFDFEFTGAGEWLDQRVLLFWEKKPLMVRVKRVGKVIDQS